MTAARERLNTSDVCVRTPLKACVHQTIDPCMQTPSRRLRAANYLISIAFGLTGRTERAGALHASIDACTGALHASIDACNPKSASACSQLPDFNCFRVDWTHETPRGVACIDRTIIFPAFSRLQNCIPQTFTFTMCLCQKRITCMGRISPRGKNEGLIDRCMQRPVAFRASSQPENN